MPTIPEKPWYLSTILAFLCEDCANAVGNPAAFARDCITVSERVTCEGEAFLTKTLPKLGKVIDFALQERGPLAQTMFKRRRKGSALPAFLWGLTSRVFDEKGNLLAQPCIISIKMLRQICFWCKKLERGYSDKSLQRALLDLIEVDGAIPRLGAFRPPAWLGYAKGLVHQVFNDFGLGGLLPKHGPGAVAGGENLMEKRRLTHSYTDLERAFRPIPYMFSLRDAAEDPQRVTGRVRCEYGLSRIAFVEKDSNGPRVIGLEPAEYQWCQQALKRAMYDYLETHRLTKGRVNFTNQEINRELARNWEDYDTLDMSKASDRNSLALVCFLFEGTSILPYLLASRTPGTILPDGRILMYNKFAPMGSAVCFPVQALVYWALALASLCSVGYPFSIAQRRVFVYGDDLIVPHGYFAVIRRNFEAVGLKFNDDKCCISGKFRESCGLDAYNGVDVTPVRAHHLSNRTRVLTDFIPDIEHANALFESGYWGAAAQLKSLLQPRIARKCGVRLPDSREPLPILHWHAHDDLFIRRRFLRSIREVQGWTVEPKKNRVPAALERNCLRESLSLGGPVGTIRARSNGGRYLALKYVCVARKRWVVIPS